MFEIIEDTNTKTEDGSVSCEAIDYALDNLKGDEFTYFYRTTDQTEKRGENLLLSLIFFEISMRQKLPHRYFKNKWSELLLRL